MTLHIYKKNLLKNYIKTKFTLPLQSHQPSLIQHNMRFTNERKLIEGRTDDWLQVKENITAGNRKRLYSNEKQLLHEQPQNY